MHVNHLPLMPFPPTFPVFIPKDKLANWFESYVEASTSISGPAPSWPPAARTTRKALDGDAEAQRRQRAHPASAPHRLRDRCQRHPDLAAVPGLDAFKGEVMHSGAYTNGADWKGRKAIVVGTGNSGHDVAQDLCASGADATIVQRSPTYIVTIREAQKVYAIYTEGLPFEDCDLLAASSPYAVMRRAYQLSTAEMRNADRDC